MPFFSHQYCPRNGPGPDPPLAPGLDLQSADVVLDKEGQGAVVKVLAAAGHAGNNIACKKIDDFFIFLKVEILYC